MPYYTPKEFTTGSFPPNSSVARVLGGISTAATQASVCQSNRLNLFEYLSVFAVKVFFMYIFISVLDKFGIPYAICRSICGKRIADNLLKKVDEAMEKYRRERREFRKFILEEVFPDPKERRAYMKRVAAKRSKLCCCCQRRMAKEESTGKNGDVKDGRGPELKGKEPKGKDVKGKDVKGKDVKGKDVKGKDNKTTQSLSGKSGAGAASGASETEKLSTSEIHTLADAWSRSLLPIWVWVIFIFPYRAIKEYFGFP